MIVGITGYARSGKDEAAKALVEKGYTRVAFADDLKQQVQVMLRSIGVVVDLQKSDLDKAFWRDLLVYWGKKRRETNPSYWIDRVRLLNRTALNGDCVVSDIRYPNEAHWVLKKGGKIILVERAGVNSVNLEEAKSIAELRAGFADDLIIIKNNSTIEHLHESVLESCVR